MVEFVQLADSVPLAKVKLPCIGQLKYNGTRCIAFCNDGKVTFSTRNQKQFTYPKLEQALQRFIHNDWVLDGELCFGDSKDTDHTKVSGIVNSSIHGNPIADNHKLSYNVFDFLTGLEFRNNHCQWPYSERYQRLQSIFVNTGPFIQVAKTWEFENHDQIQETYNDLLLQGYEGLILKYWKDTYVWKRSKNWIKMKAVKTADLKCIDTFEGLGKYTGMLGGVICVGEVEGKKIKVRVGSGLTDCHRAMPDSEFLDKIIEVKYNTIIKDANNDYWSLFLPRFVGVRFDK